MFGLQNHWSDIAVLEQTVKHVETFVAAGRELGIVLGLGIIQRIEFVGYVQCREYRDL